MMSQAQLLQCPDCGHRHDLDALGDIHTFRCEQCGRALKVPAQFRDAADASAVKAANAGASSAATSASAAPPFDGTMHQPATTPREPAPAPVLVPIDQPTDPGVPTARHVRRDGKVHVPLVWRLLIWLLAIPIGLVLVFQVIARKLGWLTSNELIDAFTAGGWDRFRPIAQLLPFAAFVIALIVQLSVYGLERLYRRRAEQRAATAAQRTSGGFTTGS